MNENINIGLIVGRYFVRVCKNHENLYNIFQKKALGSSQNRGMLNTPFDCQCKNVYDLFDLNLRSVRTDDKYEKVTMLVNNLLHYYLEGGGVDPSRLGQIGEEIFNLSCYAIYGKQFLIDMDNEKKAMLNDGGGSSEYDNFCRFQFKLFSKKMPEDLTYQDFKRHFDKQLKVMFKDFKKRNKGY